MTEINDEFLLKQLLDFCDNIKHGEGLAELSKADNFFHPLDRDGDNYAQYYNLFTDCVWNMGGDSSNFLPQII